MSATASSLRTAVMLVRATYVVKGYNVATANLPGFGNNDVETNAQGYPIDTAGGLTNTMNTTKC